MLTVLALLAGHPAVGQQAHATYTDGTAIDTSFLEQTTGSIAVDPSGNVYVLTRSGIYKETYSNGSYAFSNVASITSGAQIAVDKNGIVYASATANSDGAAQPYLYRFTPANGSYTQTILLRANLASPEGLAVDPAGNVFLAAQLGGSTVTVQEVAAGATAASTLATMATVVTNFTVDPNDNLFYTYVGQDGTVSEIPRVNGTYSTANASTPITALCHSQGCSITGLAADSGGNVYSSFVYSAGGGSERYIATGTGTFTPAYVTLSSDQPRYIAVGVAGTVYTNTGSGNRVSTRVPPQALNFGSMQLDVDGPEPNTVGFDVFTLDAPTVFQSVTTASQGNASDFAVDAVSCGDNNCVAGTTYPAGTTISVVADFFTYAVGTRAGALNLNSSSGTIATAFVTGTGVGSQRTYLPVKHTTLATGLGTPSGVAVDQAGNALVLDTSGQRLVKVVSSSGTVTALATGVTAAAGPALDAAGNVYYATADPAHSGLYEVVRLRSLNGGGTYSGTTIVASSLPSPVGIAVDVSGNVFVADSSTNAITEYDYNGGSYLARTVLTGLQFLKGLAVGADDSLFIANGAGVLKATPSYGVYGTTTTITPAAVSAYGVSVDGAGNVFVADAGNDRVVRLVAGSYASTTLYSYTNSSVYGVGATSSGDVLVGEPGTGTLGLLTLSAAPSLTFANTVVGSTSSDSPQTITFFNTGNAAVNFSGGSASVRTDNAQFTLGASSTCPSVFGGESYYFGQGASCTDLVSFTPTAGGSVTGNLLTSYSSSYGTVITDPLSGTGTASTPQVQVSDATQPYSTNDTLLNATITYTGSTAPTGAVTFTVSAATPVSATAQCTANNGVRSCIGRPNLSQTDAGTYTLTVTEAADANYGAASGTGSITITKDTPTVSAFTVPSSVAYGTKSITLTSYVGYANHDYKGPSGNLNFSVDSSSSLIAQCTTANPHACTFNYDPSVLGVGTHTVSATLAEDTNFNSNSGSSSFTITAGPAQGTTGTTTVAYGTASTVLSASFAYTGANPPTGPVTFSVNNGSPLVGTCASTSSSPRTCTLTYVPTSLAVGTYPVQVIEAADGNYGQASATGSLVITKALPVLTVNAVTGTANGSAVPLTALESYSGAAAPTGAVSFQVGTTTVPATCTGNSSPLSCTGSYDVSRQGSGTFNYTATVVTDANYTAATSNTSTITLSPAPTSLVTQPVTSSYGSSPLALTAQLTFTGSAAPTGAPTFVIDGGTSVASTCSGTASPLTCSGSYAGTALNGGTHSLSATYAGDGTYAAATSGAAVITINPVAPTVAVSPVTTAYGSTTTALNATVTYQGPIAPTGAVRFLIDGSTVVPAVCVNGTGALTCSANANTSSLSVGQHTLSASVTGDTNYTARTSADVSLTVTPATPSISVASVIAPYGSTAVNLVATVSNLQNVSPSSAVTFTIDGGRPTVANCNFAGTLRTCTASLDASSLSVASHALVATEPADGNYQAASSSGATLSIIKATPTLSAPAVTVSGSSANATLSATVAYSGVAAPTGGVSFTLSGSSAVPAVCTDTSSPLSCSVSINLQSIPAGTYPVTANLATDSNYQAVATTTTLTVSATAASTFPTCALGSIKSVSSTSNAVSVTATCSDPGGLALTTKLDWGDGTPVVAVANNGTNTHVYSSPAAQVTYTILLTGTNTAANSGTATQKITVVPITPVSASGDASVTATVTPQPAAVPAFQVTFVCTSVSTNVTGQNVTNALPSSFGISCSAPTTSSNASGPAQVTIQTTTGATRAMLDHRSSNAVVTALALPLFGLPMFAFAGEGRRRRMLLTVLVATLVVCSGLVGCGGSFTAPVTVTPSGNYYITITEVPVSGTAAPTGFVQTSLIVPLNVR